MQVNPNLNTNGVDQNGYVIDDKVEVSNRVDSNGNSYTQAISNDKLGNEDFLQLMLEEMKMQDPTKPMDSARMLQDQMQMSNIETNLSLVDSMKSLETSFSQMAVSNASNLINKVIEDGSYNQNGLEKQFMVSSVELIEGETFLTTYEVTGYDSETDDMQLSDDKSLIKFDNVTKIF